MSKLLAMDIGFAHTGYFIVEITKDGYSPIDAGAFHTEKETKVRGIRQSDDLVRRCQELAKNITTTIANVIGGVSIIAVEIPTGASMGAIANRAMGMAIGVISAVSVSERHIPFLFVTPDSVKITMGGVRSTSKEKIQEHVKKLYPDFKFPSKKKDFEHIADAVGVSETVKDDPLIRLLRSSSNVTTR